MTVRVRFAPSPTGYLHIGSARTALFNWLFAQRHNGQFILRIEDTDQKRSVPGAIEAIMDSLRWLGLDWDEGPDIGGDYGPYIQTQRAALYRQWGYWLLEQGHAYKCFCTAAELSEMRRAQLAAKAPLGYDRRCRSLTPEQVAAREAGGLSYTIRYKMPLEGETVIQDVIRGEITYKNEQITDSVLLKSDGLPTYHLANVVDDHFMKITHIMRADEWINTAPLHINLYRDFGWELPIYAHLTLIMNPSGKGKLSKRTQAFEDSGQQVMVRVEEFRQAGYLPEAVLNFLTNIGWSFGEDRELFTMEEAIPRFDLSNINPAPSRLPYSKLDWINGQYIQKMEPLELAKAVKPFLEEAGYDIDLDTLFTVMPAMRVRLKRLPDAIDFMKFLYDEAALPLTADQLIHKQLPSDKVLAGLQQARDFVSRVEPYDLDSISQGILSIGENITASGKAGPFLGKMRLAVTRQKVSPPLFESMLALGREHVLSRLDETVALF
jgi:glutamyl-tRNA synthetase